MRSSRLAALAFAVSLIATPALAGEPARQAWIPTWYAAPEPTGNVEARLSNKTLRQIVRVSVGGKWVRLRLSNAYGQEPLRIDAVGLARRESGSRIEPASNMQVTFGGKAGVTIAPGAYILSDAMPLVVSADSDLALSLYVANPTPMATSTTSNAVHCTSHPVMSLQQSNCRAAQLILVSAMPFRGLPR